MTMMDVESFARELLEPFQHAPTVVSDLETAALHANSAALWSSGVRSSQALIDRVEV